MGNKLFKQIVPIFFIWILLSACSGQVAGPTTAVVTTIAINNTETATPTSTQAPTSQPVIPTSTPFPQPTLKSVALFSDIHAQVNWQLKSKFMAQAASFISLQEGWSATETQLIHTRDGGKTWQIVADTPDTFSRLDFASPVKGWGLGKEWLYVTSDGGKTWKQQLKGSFDAGQGVWKTDIDFINEQVGWLTEEGSVLQTQDGGKTWGEMKIPPSGFPDSLYSISFTTPKKGWLMRGNCSQPNCNLTLLKTQDGGNTWDPIASGGFNDKNGTLPSFRSPDEIFFLDDLHGWFVGAFYNLGVSTVDGGKSWQELSGVITIAGPALHQLRMFNPLQGIADHWTGGFYAVVRTDNGGKTWEQIFPPLAPIRNLQFFDFMHGIGLRNENTSSFLLSTTDGGKTWLKGEDLSSCDTQFLNDKAGWGICNFGQASSLYGKLYRTIDGGKSWQLVVTPDSLVQINAHFMDAEIGVVSDNWDRLFGTQDSGKTWQPVQITQGKFPLRDDQAGWLMGSYKTLDHADKTDTTWVPVLEVGSISQFDPVTNSVAYVSANYYCELLKTIDGGRTWTRILIDGITEPDGYFNFYFVDPQHGWLVSNQGLFKTADGGLTWDQILPEIGR